MPSTSVNILELEGVTKVFRGRTVLDALSLSVRRGEALAVLGASGSGKSVLLKLLIRLLEPDAGSVRFDGRDLALLSEQGLDAVRARMATRCVSCASRAPATECDHQQCQTHEISWLAGTVGEARATT